MRLRIHFFQHVPYEGLGCIKEWIVKKDHLLTSTRFFEDNINIPDISGIDWLIIMGGPMSVHDEEKYHWLRKEKEYISQAVESGKTVIGVCLGSQLIAEVLGGKVFLNTYKEIGWFDVSLTEEGKKSSLLNDFDDTFTAFHWHGDTFSIPPGAVHLCRSEGCVNQAFSYEERVIALQFHFEITVSSLKEMTVSGLSDLVPDKYVQPEDEIISGNYHTEAANLKMMKLLDRLEEAEILNNYI